MTGLYEDHLIGKPKAELKEAYDCVMGAPDSASRTICLDRLIELVAKGKSLTPEEFQVLAQFDDHGRSASCHYADDSGREWHQGSYHESEAVSLFNKHPKLQPQMKVLAKVYLWSLDMAIK